MNDDQLRRRIGAVLSRSLESARSGVSVDIRKELLVEMPDLAERCLQQEVPQDVSLALGASEEFFEAHADLGTCEPLEPLVKEAATRLSAGETLEDGPVLRFGFITGRLPFDEGGIASQAIPVIKRLCGLITFIFLGRFINEYLGTGPLIAFVLLSGGLLLYSVRTH